MGGHTFGPNVKPVCASTGISGEIAVASQAIVYTHSQSLRDGKNFSLAYKASSVTGTADVKIEIEESWFALTEALEGASHVKYVTPEGVPAVESSIADEIWHIKTLSLVVAPF